jgi:RNA recognition motif-containing protein
VNVADNSRPLPLPGPEAGYRAVCVKNLTYETTEDELRELFGRVGPTHEIRLHLNAQGAPTGIAFVTLGSAAAAERALQFDGTLLGERTIRVNPEMVWHSRRAAMREVKPEVNLWRRVNGGGWRRSPVLR